MRAMPDTAGQVRKARRQANMPKFGGNHDRNPVTGGATITTETPVDLIAWFRDFARQKARPLRVLHVGNNAYLNAQFLRRAGVDCHVLCYDYYHMMATPEWEEADVEGD